MQFTDSRQRLQVLPEPWSFDGLIPEVLHFVGGQSVVVVPMDWRIVGNEESWAFSVDGCDKCFGEIANNPVDIYCDVQVSRISGL